MPIIQVLKNLENVVKDTLGDKTYEPEEHAEPWALQLFHVHPNELSSVDDSMCDDQKDTPAPSPDDSWAVTSEPNSVYYNLMDMDNTFMLCSSFPIAPFMTRLITPDPAIPIDWNAFDMFGSNFVREHGQINNMDDIDMNDEWMYVLSHPLHINIILTDFTAVNTIVSCIECTCHISNKIDFSV